MLMHKLDIYWTPKEGLANPRYESNMKLYCISRLLWLLRNFINSTLRSCLATTVNFITFGWKLFAYWRFKHPDLIAFIIFLKIFLIVKLLSQTFKLLTINNKNIPMHTVYHTITHVSHNVNFAFQLVNIL